MLISLVWFWFGRRQLQGIGRPIAGEEQKSRVLWVLLGAIVAIPLIYFLLAIDASNLQWVLSALFVGLCAMRSEEHTSELPSLMRISYAIFCLKTKNTINS